MKKEGNEFLSLLCNLYLVALLAALPLYTGEGYWELDETKYTLFRNVTFLCLGCWLAVGIPGRVRAVAEKMRMPGNERRKALARSFSLVDFAVAAYVACVVLSALCSSYGQLAWMGYRGWYMGAFSQILFAGIYFFVSRQYDGAVWPLYLGEFAFFLVTLFGLLHRLGIDPLGLLVYWTSRDWEYSHMLSTLGNINWLCGFYSVALAFPVVHFLREGRRWVQILLYIVNVSAFVLLAIQGSQGGLLVLAVCAGVCIFWGRCRPTVLKKTFLQLTGFFLCMPLMEGLMSLQGDKAAIVPDGNIFAAARWYFWITGAVVCLIFLVFLREDASSQNSISGSLALSPGRGKAEKRGRILASVLIFAGFIAGVALLFLLFWRGIDDSFGSGRGFLWRISIENFKQAGWKDRLLGAGPESYAEAVFNRLRGNVNVWEGDYWEYAVFTNAHNEMLNHLCNIGILGAASYLAIFLTGLYRFGNGQGRKKKERLCGIPGAWVGVLALAMYGVHSLVSFQQVLNTPLLFLALGLCEHEMRNQSREPKAAMEEENYEVDEI